MDLIPSHPSSIFHERWVVHAQRNMTILPLFPKYIPDTFKSKMELLDYLDVRIRTDVDFAVRWEGWRLIVCDINSSVLIQKVSTS